MAFKTPVNTVEKILLTIVIAASLGLFFITGEIIYRFFSSQKIVKESYGDYESKSSANLYNSAKKNLVLKYEFGEFIVPSTTIQSWLVEYFREFSNQKEFRINRQLLLTYLSTLAPKIDRPVVNARLSFGNQIQEIIPAKNGLKLNLGKSVDTVIKNLGEENLNQNENREIWLVIDEEMPIISAEKAAQLGIDSLIGIGESDFGGSTKARITNITVGAKKFNGLVLAPGEEFSFNKILGDVSPEQGFVNEMVIKNKQIIPELGGGLCQVSTTMFRAAMMAGLKIVERRPHSFPVHYYNPQGFDSTIYPGVVDLKFINDTPGYILIEYKIVGTKLSFRFYGKNDGRVVKIDGPYQYDVKPDGSMKAIVTQNITNANGEQRNEKFYSTYKSPALFPTAINPLE